MLKLCVSIWLICINLRDGCGIGFSKMIVLVWGWLDGFWCLCFCCCM